jgi:hypothetical protein
MLKIIGKISVTAVEDLCSVCEEMIPVLLGVLITLL